MHTLSVCRYFAGKTRQNMKLVFLVSLFLLVTNTLSADEIPSDSLQAINMDEIVIIASPKGNNSLRDLPTASTQLSQLNMRTNQVTSLKSLNALVPNIFIPDYGSKLTSAIYIRGIGSRINTPAVGLYVDNVPYLDKSAFDFNYADIERIDVLRGPQSTLYGRNTMGGLIHVHTKSPFTYQGTDIRLSAGNYNTYEASLTHYHRISNQFAFSVGGFFENNGGFFENTALNNQKVDKGMSGGGRFHAIALPNDRLKLDLNVNYEYSDQGGYPYFYLGKTDNSIPDPRKDKIGKISYNDECNYRRSLLNAGFTVEHKADNFTLSAVTGYQNLRDRMFLDQDFSEVDIFNLEQKQYMNTISEEIVFKSKPNRRWQWTTGAFGFYQWLTTDAPVTFKRTGIETVIEDNANRNFPNSPYAPKMHLSVHNNSFQVGGDFKTPTLGLAIYHQSTVNDLLVEGLSATLGLRLDYEKNTLDYTSVSDPLDFGFSMDMPSMGINNLHDDHMKAPASFRGKVSNDYLKLLPKVAIQYKWKDNNVYATVSRGYRSGGYNVQMFSELAQVEMRRSMMQAIINSPAFDIPGKIGGMIDKMAGGMMPPAPDVEASTIFKPEYSWNYEVGTHLSLCNQRLNIDLAAFYMNTKDQQVARFSENGLGRITVNAGKSKSAGAELSLNAYVTRSFSLQGNYGFTHATYREYATNVKADDKYKEVDYADKFVPFVPQHTFNIGGQYLFEMNPRFWLENIRINANYNGAARIFWTEANNAKENFYGTLNGRVSFEKGNGAIALWIRNALNTDYTTFYFESMGNKYMQKGKPLQFGIEVKCRF